MRQSSHSAPICFGDFVCFPEPRRALAALDDGGKPVREVGLRGLAVAEQLHAELLAQLAQLQAGARGGLGGAESENGCVL